MDGLGAGGGNALGAGAGAAGAVVAAVPDLRRALARGVAASACGMAVTGSEKVTLGGDGALGGEGAGAFTARAAVSAALGSGKAFSGLGFRSGLDSHNKKESSSSSSSSSPNSGISSAVS